MYLPPSLLYIGGRAEGSRSETGEKMKKAFSEIKLYYRKTDSGAEYLMDTFIKCNDGHKIGIFEGAQYVVRIDGNIEKDATLSIVNYSKR